MPIADPHGFAILIDTPIRPSIRKSLQPFALNGSEPAEISVSGRSVHIALRRESMGQTFCDPPTPKLRIWEGNVYAISYGSYGIANSCTNGYYRRALRNILRPRLSDRKYFGSVRASKISHNVDPLPVLGKPEILAVTHLPLDVIPQFVKRTYDRTKGLPFVVTEKPFNVFKEQKARLATFDNPCDLKKEISPAVIESLPFASNGKRLTRKSSDQKIKGRELFGSDFCDVAIVFVVRKMAAIDRDGIGIDLGVPDAPSPLAYSPLKAPDPGE